MAGSHPEIKMRIIQALRLVGLGASVFFASQNQFAQRAYAKPIASQEENQDEQDNIPIDRYTTRLKELAELPEERTSEIAGELGNLRRFYKQNLDFENAQYKAGILPLRAIVVQNSKPHLTKLFEKNLTLVLSDDIEKQMIGRDNLKALSDLFSWTNTLNIIEHAIDKENINLFFVDVLKGTTNDLRSLEVLIDSGLMLLEFARDDSNPKIFTHWINKQINSLEGEEQPERFKRCKLLERAIRDLATEKIYAQNLTYIKHSQLVISLLPSYTKLIQELKSDPDSLSNALKTFVHFKSAWSSLEDESNTEPNEEVIQGLGTSFNLALESISKLPKSKDKLMDEVFVCLHTFRNDQIEKLDFVVDSLSKYYFSQNQVDIATLNKFINSIFPKIEPSDPYTPIPTYLVFKLIDKNHDYFKVNLQELVNKLDKSNKTDDRVYAMNTLSKMFIFFELIPQVTPLGDSHGVNDLRLQVRTWSEENIQKPICKAFMSVLQTEPIEVKIDADGERIVEAKGWNWLSKNLKEVIFIRPSLGKEFMDALIKRLQTDTDPCFREAGYATFGELLPLVTRDDQFRLSFLKEVLAKPDSPQALRGIGKALASFILQEVEIEKTMRVYEPSSRTYFRISLGQHISYDTFFRWLEDTLDAPDKLSKLEGMSWDKLTPTQGFIVSLLRVEECDFDICKNYLPKDTTFETERKEDFIALNELRHNVYLILAYSASQLPEDVFSSSPPNALSQNSALRYKQTILKLLENNFRMDFMYKSPKQWAEEIASLVDIVRNVRGRSTEEKVKLSGAKLELFKDLLAQAFDFRQRCLLTAYMWENKIFTDFDSLPTKKRESILSSLKTQIDELRKDFTEQFLACAPENNLRAYRDFTSGLTLHVSY